VTVPGALARTVIVSNRASSPFVPAKAGTQRFVPQEPDSRLRGNERTKCHAPLRCALTAIALFSLLAPARAIVGGGETPGEGPARAAVILVGPNGSCTGVGLARDLVLTAAHCAPAGAALKLLEFDAVRKPVLSAIASSARHPEFDAGAAERHRVTADVALLKLAKPLSVAPAALAPAGGTVAVGERFVIAGNGVATPGDGKSAGTLRTATLVVTGAPGALQFRLVDPATQGERAGLGACTGDSGGPVFRDVAGTLMVAGLVSWSTGPKLTDGCGGLTGVTPLARYRGWIVEQARKMGSAVGR
jgi:hypothetical protein